MRERDVVFRTMHVMARWQINAALWFAYEVVMSNNTHGGVVILQNARSQYIEPYNKTKQNMCHTVTSTHKIKASTEYTTLHLPVVHNN